MEIVQTELVMEIVQTIEVDADKPFAVVLPANCGEITLSDASAPVSDIRQRRFLFSEQGKIRAIRL